MSKRVRKFEEKQRPLTAAEQEALLHMKKRNAGIQTKDTVMTVENLKLQDVVSTTPENKGYYEKGKLITPETLEQERQEAIAEEKRYTVEFNRQLEEWIKEDHHTEYKGIEFDHDDYLVRLFKMDVSSFKNFVSLEYEYSTVLKEFKLKDTPQRENVFPIVKILKKGENIKSGKYKEGDVVLVPSTDVLGEDWNPKFLHVMQFQSSQNMKPILPEGMRQSIPNVEKNWERYQFVRPWVPKPEAIDHLTYLIPETKVRGSFTKHES